jgi:ATP-dependent RNA helicase DeaD
MERQIKSLRKGVDIVVGTPGRIMDHMRRKTLVLSEVATVVLDEADEMLNMGFIDDMNTILAETPKGRQTLLFSATMPEQIVRISQKYMSEPKRVSVDAKELVAAKINQVFYEVRDIDKPKALTRILDVQDPALTLIFCHTKREVDDLSTKLQQMGYEAGAIHGDFTQAQRDEMMRMFKSGKIDILVATDVAARGLDISDVTHVINYSIPQNPDAYVHRIGRTGRAGKSGIAITFVTPREYSQLRLIERTAKTRISKGKLPTPREVREARERDLVEELEEVMAEGAHKSLHSIVADLAMKHDLADVAAAALSLIAGDLEVEDIQELSGPRPVDRGEMTRLFLTIGKKDRVKVGDMVRAIAQGSNIPGRTIGKIVLFDKHSFVEVPESIAQQVIGSVQELMIGGRKVQVKKAFPREDRKGSGKKKDSGRKKDVKKRGR